LVATGPEAASETSTSETSRGEWRRRAAELTQARERGQICDQGWFEGMAAVFEGAYLAEENPRGQSGFGGDEARWEAGRRPVADAIDRDGSFLDIGCANGHLLESVVRWSPHRIEPYGLDFAPAVAQLARERLPHWADRIFTGNALTWEPPRRFDFVRTELVYVPGDRRQEYVQRLLDRFLEPGGRLIVCGYGSPRSALAADPVGDELRALGFVPQEEHDAEAPEGGGPIVRIACVRA
jgi:SAM-dependent methyltransferase